MKRIVKRVYRGTWLEGLGELNGYGSSDERATLTLQLGELTDLKLGAISQHVSQTGTGGPFRDWGEEERTAFLATESYRLARSNLPVPVGTARGQEHDLFDGLA